MPGREQVVSSAYERLRQQAITALSKLRKDIRSIESDLVSLRKQEEQLGMITGAAPRRAAASNGASTPRGRMDWRAVLEKMPNRLNAADARKVRGLASNRSGRI